MGEVVCRYSIAMRGAPDNNMEVGLSCMQVCVGIGNSPLAFGIGLVMNFFYENGAAV